MKKYTKEFLDSLLVRDGATIIGEYEKINALSLIRFICKCGREHEKKTITLEKHNAFCSDCTLENYKKLQSTRKIVETKKIWDDIKTNNKLVCRICNNEYDLEKFPKRGDKWEKECNECNKERKQKKYIIEKKMEL